MRRLILGGIVVVLLSGAILAQGSLPQAVIVFDMPVSLAVAQGYTYRAYVDGSITPVLLTTTCTAGTPVTCEANLPTLGAGNHTIQLTAKGLVKESAKSSPFDFELAADPVVPVNIRLKP